MEQGTRNQLSFNNSSKEGGMKTSFPQWYAAVGQTARNKQGKQPTFSIHQSWSSTMKTFTFWKSLAIVAVLFLFASLEAAAQLPVRTQVVQWINPAGGTVSFDVNTGAATTPYTVSWPQSAGGAVGDSVILLGTYTALNDIDLTWYTINGFVDGVGAANHVTWWADDNTLTYSPAFEWDEANNTLSVGVDTYANGVAATGAAGPGVIEVGTGGATAEITLTGNTATGVFGASAGSGIIDVQDAGASEILLTASTATVDVGVTSAGTVNVANGTVNTAILAGATGTGTLGADGVDGELVLYDGGAGVAANTVTINTGAQTNSWTLQPNDQTAGAGPFFVAPNTNAIATDGSMDQYLLIANTDGTATWASNPLTNFKAGRRTIVLAENNTYSVTVVYGTPYALGTTPVVTLTYDNATNANIVQVTANANTGFTISSTAPFATGDVINWIANEPYDP
jgi:hypothetical protein